MASRRLPRSFLLLVTKLTEILTRRRLVDARAPAFLARLSGWLLASYVLLKAVDTIIWINRTSPRSGFAAYNYYLWEPFGTWILFAEIVVCGLLPAWLLLRAGPKWRITGAVLACCGVTLNRFVLTIQTLALPTLPFDKFMTYWPSWQETSAFAGVVAYGVIVFSLSYRYLTLFPQERDLPQA